MDFIRYNDDVPAYDDFRDGAQLVGAPDASDRVVGAAEHEQLRSRTGGVQGLKVDFVAAVAYDQLRIDGHAPVLLYQVPEGVVDGRRYDDPVTRGGESADRRRYRRNYAGRKREPWFLDPNAVTALHPPNKGLEESFGLDRIAIDGMGGARGKSLGYGRRRGEIHVGHPHRDDVRPD